MKKFYMKCAEPIKTKVLNFTERQNRFLNFLKTHNGIGWKE